jgi:hypothetical protein
MGTPAMSASAQEESPMRIISLIMGLAALLTVGTANAEKDQKITAKLDERVELCGHIAEFSVAQGYVNTLMSVNDADQLREAWNKLEDVADDVAESSRDYRGDGMPMLEKAEDTLEDSFKSLSPMSDMPESKRRVTAELPRIQQAFKQVQQSVDCK